MRKLIYGMNLSLDGYVAAPGDDIGWGAQSDELETRTFPGGVIMARYGTRG